MSTPVFHLPAGLSFAVAGRPMRLEPLSVGPGEWLAITPASDVVAEVPAPPIARLLVTLGAPRAGRVEICGEAVSSLPYVDLQRLRTKIGFVVCRGGLLSNRTVAENIGLPVSVHAHVSVDDEETRVRQLLGDFGLTGVAGRRPDELDGATRFRTCVARALALRPPWVVVEGTGDFGRPGAHTWDRLDEHRASGASLAVCLAAPDPAFEEWLAARGGRVLRYRLESEAP